MYKIAAFVLFLFNIASGQVSVKIYDSEDKNPVAYGTIWKDKTVYKTADSIGQFILEDADMGNDFKITAIGFKEGVFKIEKNKSEVFLERESVQLKEVRIVKRIRKSEEKKGKVRSGDISYGVNYDRKNGKVARLFPNDGKKNNFVKSIKFVTYSSADNRLLNLQFYAVGENGMPAALLHNENVLCRIKKGKNKNTINVDDLNIEFPANGIFIVIEHMLLEQNKMFVGKLPNSFVYEPLVYANYIDPENADTWFLEEEKWKENKVFSLNMEIVVAD